MAFDAIGNLPAGIHDYDMGQVKSEFVDSFPHSSTRPAILSGLTAYRSHLAAIVAHFEQILDGSFVTSKNDPNDVDCFISADANVINNLGPAEQIAFQQMVSGKVTQSTYRVDAYLCAYVPQGDPNYDNYRAMRKYWLGEFGFDRNENPKGLVRVVATSTSSGAASP